MVNIHTPHGGLVEMLGIGGSREGTFPVGRGFICCIFFIFTLSPKSEFCVELKMHFLMKMFVTVLVQNTSSCNSVDIHVSMLDSSKVNISTIYSVYNLAKVQHVQLQCILFLVTYHINIFKMSARIRFCWPINISLVLVSSLLTFFLNVIQLMSFNKTFSPFSLFADYL